METALVSLLSVLFGALVGGLISLRVEKSRARNERRAALLQVRREVQLDALDDVHKTIQTFKSIFVHNHKIDDTLADKAQAEAVELHYAQLDALELRAHRIDVLADHRTAEGVQAVPAIIKRYFLSPSVLAQKFIAVEINATVDQLEAVFADLKIEVRSDLGTAELDVRK